MVVELLNALLYLVWASIVMALWFRKEFAQVCMKRVVQSYLSGIQAIDER